MILKGKRVFIVEDEVKNLSVVSTILQSSGATIVVERLGKDASQKLLKSLPIDVILMDIMLPYGVSGYDVVKEIRSVPELAQIPVVAVSAADPNIEMEKARLQGFNGFISKPIRINTFSRHIADIISGNQVWLPE